MGLDAVVFCDCVEKGRLSVPHPYPRLLFIGENGSPDIRSKVSARVEEHDKWMELPPCEHEQMMLDGCELGNEGYVSILRNLLAAQEASYPVLLGKVFYDGSHFGDHLEIQDVRMLSVELEQLEEAKLLTTAVSRKKTKQLGSAIEELRRLVRVALSVNKPIAF